MERTKEGLAGTRARVKRLGRPKGARRKSKLDGREDDIRTFLTKGASKGSNARIMEVSSYYHRGEWESVPVMGRSPCGHLACSQ
ncbi:MAG: hypothetical protein OXD46_10590 [Chloroflexi bacterium]|nr:hypothetical protein [Chloroflexota bacterium]